MIFRLVEYTSQFTRDFIENYNEDSNKGYFLEVDVQYTEKLHNLRFLLKEWKLK